MRGHITEAPEHSGDRDGEARPIHRVPDSGVDNLRGWRFLTNHTRVLLAVALDPDATITEIAESVVLSRRSTFRILADLQKSGYVRRTRTGRNNRYEVNRNVPLADPLIEHEPVWKLIAALAPAAAKRGTDDGRDAA